MKNNFLKISIFLSVIIFIFACFVFVFLYKITNQNNQKAELGTVAWQTEAQRRNDIIALNSSLAQVANDRASLETHFAESSDIVSFLNTIEQLGSPSGTTVEMDSVNTGANNSELVVDLKATGNFGQVYKFLTLLENSPYEIDFNSMDIHQLLVPTVPTKKTQSPEWEGDFEIQLLSFTP
jgi:Tfp pilus assembly protein PilO